MTHLPLAETATCQLCGGPITRKLLSGVYGAWLHEREVDWFCSPHAALPSKDAA